MVRRTCWVVLLISILTCIATSVSAQQTLYFKKDHVYAKRQRSGCLYARSIGFDGADGTFRIGRLPPGTYVIEAWHERLGTQTVTVTVGASGSKDVAFTFRGS